MPNKPPVLLLPNNEFLFSLVVLAPNNEPLFSLVLAPNNEPLFYVEAPNNEVGGLVYLFYPAAAAFYAAFISDYIVVVFKVG